MAFKKAESKPQEEELGPPAGRKKYGRLSRMFREGYLSLCIYKNVHEHRTFYDIVLYRKIRCGNDYEYKRGTNYKPADLPLLVRLLDEAKDYLDAVKE